MTQKDITNSEERWEARFRRRREAACRWDCYHMARIVWLSFTAEDRKRRGFKTWRDYERFLLREKGFLPKKGKPRHPCEVE